MSNEKNSFQRQLLNDRVFLSMMILDPEKTMKSYGIYAKKDAQVAVEKAMDNIVSHASKVLSEVVTVRSGGQERPEVGFLDNWGCIPLK